MNPNLEARSAADTPSLCRLIAARNLPASLALLGFAFSAPASAGFINVDAGAVDNVVNGNCSIVEAVRASNENAAVDACDAGQEDADGADIIVLPASSTFTFTAEFADGFALPAIEGFFALEGNGSTLTAAMPDFGFIKADGNHIVTVEQTTLTGGGVQPAISISNSAYLTVVDSTISGNSGGNGASAILANYGSYLYLASSTVSDNASTDPGSPAISAVYYSTAIVSNSTLSGNSIVAGGVASALDGYLYSTVIVESTTITGNTGGAASVRARAPSAMIFENSIVVGNCAKAPTSYVQNYGSLLKGTGCGMFSSSTPDPLLGPLANNGGFTKTHALLAGSPAIDAVVSGGCGCSGLSADQRGLSRPQGIASDLGSYELFQDIDPLPFKFRNVTGAVTGTWIMSEVVTPVDYFDPAPVSVLGGEYRLNGGIWTAVSGTIRPGDTLQLRLNSPGSTNTAKSMTVRVGNVPAKFIVKTGAVAGDANPDVFSFVNNPRSALNTLVSSRAVTPVGYSVPAPVSVAPAGCFYRVNGGAPVTSGVNLLPGDKLQLAITTPPTNATKFFCDVTLGATKVRWIGTTLP